MIERKGLKLTAQLIIHTRTCARAHTQSATSLRRRKGGDRNQTKQRVKNVSNISYISPAQSKTAHLQIKENLEDEAMPNTCRLINKGITAT